MLQLECIGTLMCLISVIFFSCLTLSYTDDLHFSAAPSEPTNFNLLPNTSSSLSVTWEVPARPNGIMVGLHHILHDSSHYCHAHYLQCAWKCAITLTDGPGAIHYMCEVTANTSAGSGNSSNTDTERMDEDGKDFFNEKC